MHEWHTDDMWVHTSDIGMRYEYIRVTYRRHTSTYKWYTDDLWEQTSDMRITKECIWVTYYYIRVHTSDVHMIY